MQRLKFLWTMVTNTVSLKITLTERRAMLLDPSPYIGQTMRFTGMGAVEDGCPRRLHREYQG
jgi:hypothetical protein